MTKLKAVLDQETWVEVDVPDEFQTIVHSLFGTEPSSNGEPEVSQNSTLMGDGGIGQTVTSLQQDEQTNSTGDIGRQAKSGSTAGTLERNKVDDIHSSHTNNSNTKERGKASAQSIVYRNVGYHMVNWLVIL